MRGGPVPSVVCAGALSLLSAAPVAAQEQLAPTGITGEETPTETERKRASATRVDNGTIRVDGHLDEGVWGRASAVTDFIQKEPVQGASPTDDRPGRCLAPSGFFEVLAL